MTKTSMISTCPTERRNNDSNICRSNVLGLCGQKRAGKDSVYKILASEFFGVQRIAFADPVKEELAKACGVTVDFIEQHKEEFRGGLAWWGTDFRRSFDGQDYWITKAHKRLLEALHGWTDLVVFTDVRFPNEADYIRSQGGVLWHIVRKRSLFDRMLSWMKHAHESERWAGKIKVDRVIRNDGTMTDLRRKVLGAMQGDVAFGHLQPRDNKV